MESCNKSAGIFDRIWLKKIRSEKGVTQRQVAEICGCNEITYTKVELGYNKPGLMLAIKLADFLGFDIHKFADEEKIA